MDSVLGGWLAPNLFLLLEFGSFAAGARRFRGSEAIITCRVEC